MALFLDTFTICLLFTGGSALRKTFKDDLAISSHVDTVSWRVETSKPTADEGLLSVEQKVSDSSSMGLLASVLLGSPLCGILRKDPKEKHTLARRGRRPASRPVELRAGANEGSFIDPPDRSKLYKPSPAQLTSLIKNSASIQDLLSLHATHQDNFNGIHASAAWQKIRRLRKPRNWKSSFDMSALESTTVNLLPRAGTREVSNIAHGAAAARYCSLTLFKALAAKSEERLGDFSAQDLANTVWAFATIDYKAPKLFQAVAEKAEERLGNFTPQGLANTVWAFATVGYKAPKLFQAVAEKAEERLGEFNPQELSNTVWAFATVGYIAPKLFLAVAEKAEDRLGNFNPQNLANTVWAFATVGYAAPKLFQAVAENAEERLGDFNAQGLANTVWAFATVGYKAPTLFQAVAEKAEERLGDFKPQELANVAWAYAVLNFEAPNLFTNEFVNNLGYDNLYGNESLNQFHQWNLWLIELGVQPQLSADMRARCHQTFTSGSATISYLQADVMATLRKMNITPAEEVQTRLGYSLDGVVAWSNSQIALEVDGPNHFIDHDPNGATILKRRQLRSLGAMKLCSVPYWEWDACGTTADKKNILRNKLDLALAEESPKLRVADLKLRLKSFGLKASGTKPVLLERLRISALNSTS